MTKDGPKPAETPIPGSNLGGKYLLFQVRERTYGLDILHVHEIVGNRSIMPVPTTNPCLKGLISLAGSLVPAVALCKGGTHTPDARSRKDCIIVALSARVQVALIVDKVLDVCDIPDANIRHSVPADAGVESRLVQGVASLKDKEVILLDIRDILSEEDARLADGSVSDSFDKG